MPQLKVLELACSNDCFSSALLCRYVFNILFWVCTSSTQNSVTSSYQPSNRCNTKQNKTKVKVILSWSYSELLSWRLGPDWLFCCLAHIDDRAVQAWCESLNDLPWKNAGPSIQGTITSWQKSDDGSSQLVMPLFTITGYCSNILKLPLVRLSYN